MRRLAILAAALCWWLPGVCLAAPDLTPGVSRTYVIDTTVVRSDVDEEFESTIELELTPFRTADGEPALRYRSVTGEREYKSDLLRVLVRAFDKTPIEIRLSPEGTPIGLVDWPIQRGRLVEAVLQSGRDQDIDATSFSRPIEINEEAVVMTLLTDEVRLLSLLQGVPNGAVDGVTCTRSVMHQLARQPSQQTLWNRDEARSRATLSLKDGWVVNGEIELDNAFPDGTEQTLRYGIRRLNPPDPSSCPAGQP